MDGANTPVETVNGHPIGSREAWQAADQIADRNWQHAKRQDHPPKRYPRLAEPRVPEADPARVLAAIKAEITKRTLGEGRFAQVLGYGQRDGRIITATDGYVAVLEPGASTGGRSIEPVPIASVLLPPAIARVLKRIRPLAAKGLMRWRWNGRRVTVSGQDGEYGEASEWIAVDQSAPAGGLETGIDSHFLIPLFGAAATWMDWPKDPVAAIGFRPEGASWKYLVMPVRM